MSRALQKVSDRDRAIVVLMVLIGCSLFSDPSVAGSANRLAFVTSADGTADLDTWPEADGGLSGLAAGDSICRNLASAAGHSNAANFVAWLSSELDDAYCRVHGLAGKRSSNCGQAALPESAGPWVRTDGYPWAPEIAALTSGDFFVFTPLNLDENGQLIASDVSTFTTTDRDGERGSAYTTCSDWTASPVAGVGRGEVSRTIWGWTANGGTICSTTRRLICLETVAGPPLPEIPTPTRPAFVTSVAGTGDLGSWPEADLGAAGIEAGDSICRNLATTAGLEGASHYLAWLSDPTTIDAIDRFQLDGPWQRLDGVPLADNKADLTDGLLFSTITWTDQSGVTANHGVWTGTEIDGRTTGADCQGWVSSSSALNGRSGTANSAGIRWSSEQDTPCDSSFLRLYCLADLPFPIFADGFESGDVLAWSSSVP